MINAPYTSAIKNSTNFIKKKDAHEGNVDFL